MNKKPTILAVGVLGSLALIGTGFAGWVITATATETANGSITAYTVADNRVFIDEAKKWDNHATTEAGWENGAIRFGKPADYAESTDDNGKTIQWLTAKNDVGEEKLAAVYTFTGKFTNDNLIIVANYSITGAEDALTAYTAARTTKAYIDAPAVASVESPASITKKASVDVAADDAGVYYTVETSRDEGSSLSDEGSATNGTLRHTFEINVYWVFHWGDHFNHKNPFVYYNGLGANSAVTSGASQTFADDASISLAELFAANNVNFSFTFDLTTSA